MTQRQTLPVLPLRGTVIFPGLTAPIAAGRPGTLRAIEAALKSERLVFAVAQRDNTDEPTPDILYSMGVIARIGQIQRGLGGVQLLLQGEQRATSLQYSTTEGDPALRTAVAARLTARGLATEADGLVVTGGSQQGLALLLMAPEFQRR